MYEAFSEGELVGLLNELKAELAAQIRGDRFISLSTGGKSFQRQVRSYDVISRNLADITVALQVLNPTQYGSPTTKTYVYGGGVQLK